MAVCITILSVRQKQGASVSRESAMMTIRVLLKYLRNDEKVFHALNPTPALLSKLNLGASVLQEDDQNEREVF